MIYSPLPVHWPHGRRFRGRRISTLPTGYVAWFFADPARLRALPPPSRAALIAESGLRVMSADQAEGR